MSTFYFWRIPKYLKIDAKVRDLLNLKPPTTVGIYAKLGAVDLKIMSKSRDAKNAARSIAHVPDVVVERRLHDYNVTPLTWRPLGTILTARLMLARGLLIARRRVRMRPPATLREREPTA